MHSAVENNKAIAVPILTNRQLLIQCSNAVLPLKVLMESRPLGALVVTVFLLGVTLVEGTVLTVMTVAIVHGWCSKKNLILNIPL